MFQINNNRAASLSLAIAIAAAGLILTAAGPALAQAACTTYEELNKQKETIETAEGLKQRDCWVAKAKGGERNLRGAFLQGADLKGLNLKNVSLLRANLQGANLNGANLKDVVLVGANISKADLRNANLTDANLKEANLSYAQVDDATFSGAMLQGADLTGWRLLSDLEVALAEAERRNGGEPLSAMDRRDIENDFIMNRENRRLAVAVDLNGAKASKTTKGITAEVWKSKGGVFVD